VVRFQLWTVMMGHHFGTAIATVPICSAQPTGANPEYGPFQEPWSVTHG
jgi:hypothetical protein